MQLLKDLIFIFVVAFSSVSAENLPKYRMIDLGVFETDQSYASAINNNGQVLGTYREGACNFIFLWDQVNGITIIDSPEVNIESLKLNENGQIAYISYLNNICKVFYWDNHLGFWEVESSKENIQIVAFNAIGQILGNVGNQMFIWDHGKKTNLTALFREQVPGNWSSFQATSLNNHGHVAFSAYKSNTTGQQDGQDTWGEKSFLWKDGLFKIIMPEKNWGDSISVMCMDDDENMIVNTYSQSGGAWSQHFISKSNNISAACQGCDIIRNGLPIARDCLPGKLKKDNYGKLYFSKGVQIKKLFDDEFPYYNIPNTTEIYDQNSKGYVVGGIDTMFQGCHAFLAIPETQKKDECEPLNR